MNNEIIYKVLWVDDQNLNDQNELTDFYDGWQLKADSYNIELVPFDNWEDAELTLKKDFDEFSAIILDANCKIKKNDTEQESFIIAILPQLTKIFAERQKSIPWYLLSAGTMNIFSSIVEGAKYHDAEKRESWGEMLYLKDASEESKQSPSALFKNITRVAQDMAMNIALYRHQDTFCYMGDGNLIDARARKLLLQMLSALYCPEEYLNFEYKGNPLRHVVEYLFRSARKQGLLADECFKGEDVKTSLASHFMAGHNVTCDSDNSKQVRWGEAGTNPDGSGGDSIFNSEIADIVKRTLKFTNEDSHTSEDEPWYIGEEKRDIFFSYVLQVCHVIRWYGKYIEAHDDIEANHRNICYTYASPKSLNKDKFEGKEFLVEQDERGNYHCGECRISYKTAEKVLGKYVILYEVSENKAKSKDNYPFYANFKAQKKDGDV